MELVARCTHPLLRYDACQSVIPWRVDGRALADDEDLGVGQDSHLIGRILADELRRSEVGEWGEDPYEVADADSSGLEVAYRCLLDESGEFREEEFDGVADPVIYLYRFELHPDFANWRLAILDAVCHLFYTEAIILAQLQTTELTQAEFELVGFKPWTPAGIKPPADVSDIYARTRFMVRDNTRGSKFQVSDYPKEAVGATAGHAKWVKSRGPWKGLC